MYANGSAMASRAGKETFRFRLVCAPELFARPNVPFGTGGFCNYFSFLIANLAQRYHEFHIENRNHMSKS